MVQPESSGGQYNIMADIGIPELLIILFILFILFGPGRLAGAGEAIGQAIREFRQSVGGSQTGRKSVEVKPALPAADLAAETTPEPESTV
jgi:sec-independent protein translocase protein TatA